MNSIAPRALAPVVNLRSLEQTFHLSSAQVEHAANSLRCLILLKAANPKSKEKYEAQIQLARVTLIGAKMRHDKDRRVLNAAIAEGVTK